MLEDGEGARRMVGISRDAEWVSDFGYMWRVFYLRQGRIPRDL